MSFGVLDWIIVVAFLASVLICTLRGFVKSIAGVARIFGAFLLAKIFGPLLGRLISLHVIGPKVYAWIEEKVTAMVGGVSDAMNLDALFEEGSEFSTLLNRFGASEQLGELEAEYGNTVEATTETLSEMVRSFATPWVDRLSTAIACVLVFIVSFVVLWLLTKLFVFLIERIRVLKRTNRILGLVLGLVAGVYAVIGVCYAVSLLSGILAFFGSASDGLLASVDASMLFRHIYGFVIR